MSDIPLSLIKADLRITHDDDDALLRMLIAAAIDEARQFLDVDELPQAGSNDPLPLPDSSDYPDGVATVAPSIYAAVSLLVRAQYEADGDEIERLRARAETLLMPYRQGIGA